MEDATRTPLEQLESEAIYLLRESAALFENPVMALGQDPRSQVLAELARRAFAPTPSPLRATTEESDETGDAVIFAQTGDSFEVWPLFGKPPRESTPYKVFPLASWSDDDVKAFLGSEAGQEDQRLLRLCTVGEPEVGKSTVVKGLVANSPRPEGESAVHQHLRTARRRLFIIDPPGQEPYSHGLMAAASASELALLVVDAGRGLTTTGKRQAFLLALMGVPHLVVVVNKMDLVDYSRAAYENILADFQTLTAAVEIKNLSFVPVAADSGANLVEPSEKLAWYQGPALVEHLEGITPGSLRNLTDLRLPVQTVAENGSLAVGGRLASGKLALGDRVVVLPSGEETEIVALNRGESAQQTAYAGDSVTLELDRKVKVGTGDIIASPQSLPSRSSSLEAVLLWLGDDAQQEEKRYLLHHGTRLVSAHVSEVLASLEPETLDWREQERLWKGDIGRVRLTTSAPLYFDSYTSNRETGAVAVLDWDTQEVLGTGILRGLGQGIPDVSEGAERLKSDYVVKDPSLVPRQRRMESYGHQAAVLWFTGLSGSGKSAVAKEVEKRLFERGCRTLFLDGDNVRSGLNGDLGFTEEARTESTRRMGELARLVFDQGQIVVCSFISGKAADREFVRSLIPQGHFYEFYVSCPIDVCRARDPKNLYRKADAGELLSFSGISIPYDEPRNPSLRLPSDQEEVAVLAGRVMELLEKEGLFSPTPG